MDSKTRGKFFNFFVLDSNVVIDLLHTADNPHASHASQVAHLLSAASTLQASLLPDMAIRESFRSQATAGSALSSANEVQAHQSFDRAISALTRRFEIPKKRPVAVDHITRQERGQFERAFPLTRAHVAKIRLLAAEGVTERTGFHLFQRYVDWMITDCQIVLGSCYFIAAAVFGGHPAARSLLKLDHRATDVPRQLDNAAWDLLHIFVMHDKTVGKVGRFQRRAFLVTADKACYDLASHLALVGVTVHRILGPAPIVGSSFDKQPNFLKHEAALAALVRRVQVFQSGPALDRVARAFTIMAAMNTRLERELVSLVSAA